MKTFERSVGFAVSIPGWAMIVLVLVALWSVGLVSTHFARNGGILIDSVGDGQYP